VGKEALETRIPESGRRTTRASVDAYLAGGRVASLRWPRHPAGTRFFDELLATTRLLNSSKTQSPGCSSCFCRECGERKQSEPCNISSSCVLSVTIGIDGLPESLTRKYAPLPICRCFWCGDRSLADRYHLRDFPARLGRRAGRIRNSREELSLRSCKGCSPRLAAGPKAGEERGWTEKHTDPRS